MRRRDLLASIVAAGTAGLAGCAGGRSRERDTETATAAPVPDVGTPTRTVTDAGDEPTPTATPGPAWIDGPSDAVASRIAPIGYTVEPTRRTTGQRVSIVLGFDRAPTEDRPARLRGYLRNERSFPETLRIRELPTLGVRRATRPEGGDATLRLVPTADHGFVDRAPSVVRDGGRWRVADDESGGDDRTAAEPLLPETYRLPARGRVSLAYHPVWTAGETATGVYEFPGNGPTASITVATDGSNTDATDPSDGDRPRTASPDGE